MRHIIPISGKDSCATAILQMARQPDLPYELFFSDVGCELPETYAWLDLVEKKLGRPVHRVGESLERIIAKYGILPSPRIRFCTREAKIEPMEAFIGDDDATVYFGIRADEDRVGYQPTRHNLIPSYPLKDAGIGLQGVYLLCDKLGLRPPTFFWQRLYDMVLDRMENQWKRSLKVVLSPREFLASLPVHVFNPLFAWRQRSNCYFCFFQGEYEWVGLLEYHPDLFARAEEIETRVGNDQQEIPYTWMRGISLAEIRTTAEHILRKRAVRVIRLMQKKPVKRGALDLLTVTSCGLFCGK